LAVIAFFTTDYMPCNPIVLIDALYLNVKLIPFFGINKKKWKLFF